MSSTTKTNDDDTNNYDNLLYELTKEQLDDVVDAIKHALSNNDMRIINQRAVQAKIWHEYKIVALILQNLRSSEENIRNIILAKISELVYDFHQYAIDATLDRAGIMQVQQQTPLSTFCLDAKERLYIIIKEYDWIQDFFRRYPIHFYENSFQFVHNIPNKVLPVKVKVIGLGIGGSMAVSGLAKNNIKTVYGYEKRPLYGPRSTTSRYQNASWRAYDTASKMVDETAYQLLVENRQQIHVQQPDGTTKIVSADRVQIILGNAISAAIESAKRYGATLYFDNDKQEEQDNNNECYDIVALFCGGRTAMSFDGLEDGMKIHTWTELNSYCDMWLQVQISDKTYSYCTRGGEIGAERWHYTIESARNNIIDLQRIQWNQQSQYEYDIKQINNGIDIGITKDELIELYETRRKRLDEIIKSIKEKQQQNNNKEEIIGTSRFDYIFTNAPSNDHNRTKRNAVINNIVLEGKYTVEVKIATNNTIIKRNNNNNNNNNTENEIKLLNQFNTNLIICGGDASVPPNPQAAYGATLACENAYSLVLLSIGIGHINAILNDMNNIEQHEKKLEWKEKVEHLKDLLALHYEARARAENYFQWVQTLICNAYSLPPFY